MSSWPKSKIEAWLHRTEFNLYQGIDLPFGLEVPGPRRDGTVDAAFTGLPIEGKNILVVGGHYGCVPNILVDRGARRVYSMEARPKYAEIARTICEIRGTDDRITVVTGNSEFDDLPALRFDYATLFNVNHHFENPVASLKKVAKRARVAFLMEWATLETYNDRHEEQVDVEAMEQWPICLADKYHCWYMTEKAIVMALEKEGFRLFDFHAPVKASTRRIVQCRRR